RQSVGVLFLWRCLLDVVLRWYFVEGKVARIDHAETIEGHEPDSAIQGFRDRGIVGSVGLFMLPYAVIVVKDRGMENQSCGSPVVDRESPHVNLRARQAQ